LQYAKHHSVQNSYFVSFFVWLWGEGLLSWIAGVWKMKCWRKCVKLKGVNQMRNAGNCVMRTLLWLDFAPCSCTLIKLRRF
jgi:hypothetical protein